MLENDQGSNRWYRKGSYVSYLMVLLCLLIMGKSLKGQQYADSLGVLTQSLLAKQSDSAHLPLLQETITRLQDPVYQANDSLLMALFQPLITELSPDSAGLPFIHLLQRYIRHQIQAVTAETVPRYLRQFEIEALLSEADYFEEIDDRSAASQTFFKVLAMAEQAQDTVHIITTLQKIGSGYFNLGDLTKAGEHFIRAYRIAQTYYQANIPVKTYYYLLEYYIATDSTEDQVNKMGELVVAQAQKEGNPQIEGLSYRALAYYYYKLKEPATSYFYAKEALTVFEENGLENLVPLIVYRLFYTSFQLKQYGQAEQYLDMMKPSSQQSTSPGERILYHESAFELFRAKGDYQLALQNHVKFKKLQDSLNSASIKRRMYDQEYQYEYRQKALTDSLQYAHELTLQEAETRRGRTVSYLLIALLVLTVFFGAILWNRFRLTREQKRLIEVEKAKLDEANAKLQELDQFKSRFFTNISHEFRTPLTVIGGMIEQVEQAPDKWLKSGSQLIKQNVRNLLNLINQILDLRKIESGKLSLSPIQDDIIPFLRSRTEAFQSLAEHKGVGLEFQATPSSLLIDFDPDKLLLILTNLISNAIKFTSKGGQIKVQVKQGTSTQLHLTVQDSGMGISPDKLPFIFDRFYQVDDSPTREGEGTGIGLSLTKELVQLMGGDIQVSSTLGLGTTFGVTLPITQAALQASPQVPLPTTVLEKEFTQTIPTRAKLEDERLPDLLIIEDNPDVATYLQACLEDSYNLWLAKDGEEGIELALSQVPDLIISDVMMPKKNGYEVCNTLKLDERTSHIPIVLLTAKADRDSRLEGLGKGADAYLTKPFDQDELFIRLEKLFELRSRLRQRYAGSAAESPAATAAFQLEDAFIQKVKQAVLNQIDQTQYRSEDLCRDIGVSRTQLHNKIKALTGKTPAHFVRSIRLEKAKEIMRSSDTRVTEVAYAVGFSDPAYFSRVFTKENQLSPSEWREQQAAGIE